MLLVNELSINSLQRLFIKEFNKQERLINANTKMNFHNKEMLITFSHPTNKDYNILVSVKEEIIVFINVFHTHFENYSEEKIEEELVEGSLNYVKELLTAQEIIITKLSKGGKEYKYKLDIVTKGGTKVCLEDIYVGVSGALLFMPTKEAMSKASFTKTLDET